MKHLYPYILAGVSLFASFSAHGFQRNVLLEEFTTEACNNCPGGAAELHEIMAAVNSDYPARVNMVAHHSGFLTDFLTSEADLELVELYAGYPGTFAPGCCVDRVKFPDEACIVLPAFTEMGMETKIREQLSQESDGKVAIHCATDVNKTWVDINVKAERTGENVLENARLTVYLVENDVAPRRQQGAPEGFMHQHVIRAYNSVWGEPVEWKGCEAGYEISFDIQLDWIPKNLYVVAFLNEYEADEPFARQIYNSAISALNGISGIREGESIYSGNFYEAEGQIYAESGEECAVYTLTGKKIANRNLSSGLYIVATPTSQGKIMIK